MSLKRRWFNPFMSFLPVSSLFPLHRGKERKKVIWKVHGCTDGENERLHEKKIRRWKKYGIYAKDVIIVESHAMKKTLQNTGVKNPIYVVPQSVDTTLFSPSSEERKKWRNSLGIEESRTVVLLGKTAEHGEAASLVKAFPNVLFAKCREKGEMKEGCPANLLLFEKEDRLRAYRGCDLFLSLCAEEQQLLEAMACGLAVLVHGKLWLKPENALETEGNTDPFEELPGALGTDLRPIKTAARQFAMERDVTRMRKMLRQIYEIEELEEESEIYECDFEQYK